MAGPWACPQSSLTLQGAVERLSSLGVLSRPLRVPARHLVARACVAFHSCTRRSLLLGCWLMALRREEDPLARVFAPPPDETPADRQARLHAEAEAKRISDAIDEELQQEAKASKKGPRPMKMLLLGGLPCVRRLIEPE